MTKTVAQYIAGYPREVQVVLKKARALVKKTAPKAEETFSYGMVGYKLYGRPLVYFGAYKNHLGFYATPAGHVAFKKEMAKYKNAKGSVQFPYDEKIPYGLIKRIVTFRVKENAAKYKK